MFNLFRPKYEVILAQPISDIKTMYKRITMPFPPFHDLIIHVNNRGNEWFFFCKQIDWFENQNRFSVHGRPLEAENPEHVLEVLRKAGWYDTLG